jgi:hypothetical protein
VNGLGTVGMRPEAASGVPGDGIYLDAMRCGVIAIVCDILAARVMGYCFMNLGDRLNHWIVEAIRESGMGDGREEGVEGEKAAIGEGGTGVGEGNALGEEGEAASLLEESGKVENEREAGASSIHSLLRTDDGLCSEARAHTMHSSCSANDEGAEQKTTEQEQPRRPKAKTGRGVHRRVQSAADGAPPGDKMKKRAHSPFRRDGVVGSWFRGRRPRSSLSAEPGPRGGSESGEGEVDELLGCRFAEDFDLEHEMYRNESYLGTVQSDACSLENPAQEAADDQTVERNGDGLGMEGMQTYIGRQSATDQPAHEGELQPHSFDDSESGVDKGGLEHLEGCGTGGGLCADTHESQQKNGGLEERPGCKCLMDQDDLVVKVDIIAVRVITPSETETEAFFPAHGAPASGRRGRHDRYAVYIMEVCSKQGRINRVSRRYHDFSELHQRLEPSAAKEAGLRLPPKHIFSMSSLSENFLCERQGELQRYVDRLIASPALMRTSPVHSFFLGASEDPEGAGTNISGADTFSDLVAADIERGRRRTIKVLWDKKKEDKKVAKECTGGGESPRSKQNVGTAGKEGWQPFRRRGKHRRSVSLVEGLGGGMGELVAGEDRQDLGEQAKNHQESAQNNQKAVADMCERSSRAIEGGSGNACGPSFFGTFAEVAVDGAQEGASGGRRVEKKQERKGARRSVSLDRGRMWGKVQMGMQTRSEGAYGSGQGGKRGEREGKLANLLFDCVDAVMSLSQV